MTAEHFTPSLRSASQSSIPVVTPRPSRSSISSAFPLSQTSLVSQLRRTSEGSSQQSPASTSVTLVVPQTPASSIPSFRSLRSLLPFAPAKTSNPPPPSPSNAPKLSFVNFGSLRRMAHDRKYSATHPRPQEPEQVPVIAIARPSQNFEEEMIARKRSRDTSRPTPDRSLSDERTNEECEPYGISPLTSSATFSDDDAALPLPSPGPPLGADLSTIIEAENSGISKHIPYLGDGTHGDGDDSLPTSPFDLERTDRSRIPSPQADSRAASVFDLSTSKLAAEVMQALNNEDTTTASEWLNGVNGIVVEESAETLKSDPHTPVNVPSGDEDLDATLDFDTLDPSLAQLLSPNSIKDRSQSPSPVARSGPSRTHSRSPSHPVPASPFHLVSENGILPRTSPRLDIVVPPTSRIIAQSLSSKRSASLSIASPGRGPPSSLPRLMRSVTNTPLVASDSDGSSTPSGLRAPSQKRYQPPSPLSSQAHSSPSPASSHGSMSDMQPRRLAVSRLAPSNRHVSSTYALGGSRLEETPAHIPSTSQKAMPFQSVPRSASDPTRQPDSRPSLDANAALDVKKRRRPHLFYNRRRSMSVEEARLTSPSGSTSPIRPSSSLSNRPPAMEWLGPRTVKAFAAAGLLDGDRDGSSTHTSGAGRYASLRAHNERDNRFVPSRMGFSEAASTSSWGRSGSVSRVMTPSEGGITWGSPTFSAPRTTFSGSTAPTSISATSSSQRAAMQALKEKHELEMEAILSALFDSQQTTRTLREENTQLRDRIRELEDEVDDTRTQMHRIAAASALPPPPLPHGAFARSSPQDRSALLPSPLMVPRRPAMQRSISHAHNTNGYAMSAVNLSLGPGFPSRSSSPSRRRSPAPAPIPVVELEEVAAPRPRRRRASTTSSVFPSLPQNMSLLTSETMYDHRFGGPLSNPPSPAPSSPTKQRHPNLCNFNGGSSGSLQPHSLGHHAHVYDHTYAHSHSSSLSSGVGKISPTIASFSLTEIPGSPSSLQLRPEHELHLGDMASLSLYAMSDEEL